MPTRCFRSRRLFPPALAAALLTLSLGAAPPAPRPSPVESPVTSRELSALVDRVRTKVVFIDTHVGRGGRAGTGFFAASGRVLTSEHVVRDADRITVWSNAIPYRAKVIASRADLDLALLELSHTALLIKPLPLAVPNSTFPGEAVLIVGTHPNPAAPSIRQTHIEGRFLGPSWFEWPARIFSPAMELSAEVQPGDSGSPVLRLRDGAVIGVVRARDIPDGNGFSRRAWAVPIDVAFPLLARADTRSRQATRPSPDEEFYLQQP